MVIMRIGGAMGWRCNAGASSAKLKSLTESLRCLSSSSFSANRQNGAVLDGKVIASDISSRIAGEVHKMKDAIARIPGLGIVLVGGRKDSRAFIRTKVKACNEVGIVSVVAELPNDSKENDICDAVSRFNDDPSIHGIIVQLPLPKHMDEERIMNAVSVEKDVDGFHPLNIGNLAIKEREPLFIPCAPKACLELLLRFGLELRGKKAAVVGRSKIVGLPTSLLLQRHHAAVSVVDALTENPERITCEADIVVSDVGKPNTIRGHWLKTGAVVIDTGINSIMDPERPSGYRLIGDVCYEEAIKKVSAITPVPGGVGPVTIAMLLSNTLDSAKRHGLMLCNEITRGF